MSKGFNVMGLRPYHVSLADRTVASARIIPVPYTTSPTVATSPSNSNTKDKYAMILISGMISIGTDNTVPQINFHTSDNAAAFTQINCTPAGVYRNDQNPYPLTSQTSTANNTWTFSPRTLGVYSNEGFGFRLWIMSNGIDAAYAHMQWPFETASGYSYTGVSGCFIAQGSNNIKSVKFSSSGGNSIGRGIICSYGITQIGVG